MTRAKARRRQGRVVFMTGYPGFIGQRLAAKILQSEADSRLLLLTQDKFVDKAQAYLAGLPASQKKRAEIIPGDIVAMDLGLSGDEYQRVTEQVTDIYHLASIYYLGVPKRELYRVNVDGTRQVLDLARECRRLQRLNHFSTAYVSGTRVGVIREEELDCRQSFRNDYERTKFMGEQLMHGALDELPITIFRPSIVVGDSRTGEIDQFRGIYHFGILVVASPVAVPMPLPVEGVAPLNMVPIDYMVDACHLISRAPAAIGRTFHIVDPNPLSSRQVYEMFARHVGKKMPRWSLNYNLTRRLLRIPGLEKLARHSTQTLDFLNHIAIYNSPNTLELLEGSGTLCPRFESYYTKLIRYVQQHMAEQRHPVPQADAVAKPRPASTEVSPS